MSSDSPDDGGKGGKPGGFKVTDRRIFTEESAPVPDAPVSAPAPAPATAAAPPVATAVAPPVPAIDFHTFVLSLGSSVLLHLGELERPGAQGGPETDLSMAKQTIDILGMLQEKTRGNLTPAEAKLIESLLYDLRLRYVEATKKKP
jgi:Domain of unknown function (DUF1844)